MKIALVAQHATPLSCAGTSQVDDDIRLNYDAATFGRLPLFENVHAVPVDATTKDGKRFEPGELVNYLSSEFGLGGAPYLAPEEITHAEPATAGAIPSGRSIRRFFARAPTSTWWSTPTRSTPAFSRRRPNRCNLSRSTPINSTTCRGMRPTLR